MEVIRPSAGWRNIPSMSKSDRQRAAEARQKAWADQLGATTGISVDGRELKPGNREYEQELKKLMRSASPDELRPSIGNKLPKA